MSKDTLDFPAPVPWDELPEVEPEIICSLTGAYCTGDFCDEYGCAKKAGIWDEEDL